MNNFWHTLVECFVERTHSTSRSTPRTRPHAESRSTITDALKVLVSELHLLDGRRWTATIRRRDVRFCGAVLCGRSSVLWFNENPMTMTESVVSLGRRQPLWPAGTTREPCLRQAADRRCRGGSAWPDEVTDR
jgi:hypothetical protein